MCVIAQLWHPMCVCVWSNRHSVHMLEYRYIFFCSAWLESCQVIPSSAHWASWRLLCTVVWTNIHMWHVCGVLHLTHRNGCMACLCHSHDSRFVMLWQIPRWLLCIVYSSMVRYMLWSAIIQRIEIDLRHTTQAEPMHSCVHTFISSDKMWTPAWGRLVHRNVIPNEANHWITFDDCSHHIIIWANR